jgi:GNAT superfamily N-acetyltransferase
MNQAEILALYDRHERVEAEYPFMRREATDDIIRHIATNDEGGVVIYSRLTHDRVDAAVNAQIAFFEEIGQEFEWKVFDHDAPSDLRGRLIGRRFEAEEPESIMVLDLRQAPAALLQPATHDVRPIRDPAQIPSVLAVQQEVWGNDESWLVLRLSATLRSYPELISVYAAYVDDQPVASAWLYHDARSPFASLWGGSTLPAYRKLGQYTALLAVRAQEAMRRGARYLTVDASPMSRPILARHGFVHIATAHACHWRSSPTPA